MRIRLACYQSDQFDSQVVGQNTQHTVSTPIVLAGLPRPISLRASSCSSRSIHSRTRQDSHGPSSEAHPRGVLIIDYRNQRSYRLYCSLLIECIVCYRIMIVDLDHTMKFMILYGSEQNHWMDEEDDRQNDDERIV